MPVCPRCGTAFIHGEAHPCRPVNKALRLLGGAVVALVTLFAAALLLFWWVMSGFKN